MIQKYIKRPNSILLRGILLYRLGADFDRFYIYYSFIFKCFIYIKLYVGLYLRQILLRVAKSRT
jgi:hypothetical protein